MLPLTKLYRERNLESLHTYVVLGLRRLLKDLRLAAAQINGGKLIPETVMCNSPTGKCYKYASYNAGIPL